MFSSKMHGINDSSAYNINVLDVEVVNTKVSGKEICRIVDSESDIHFIIRLGTFDKNADQRDKITLMLWSKKLYDSYHGEGADLEYDGNAIVDVAMLLDIPKVKVLMDDLFHSRLLRACDQSGNHGGHYESLFIGDDCTNCEIRVVASCYRVEISNPAITLGINLPPWQLRELAVSVLDYLRNYELTRMFALRLSGQAQEAARV